MRAITVWIFFVLSIPAFGQSDSLWRLIKNSPDDTLKVQRLDELGQLFEEQNPDSALVIYTLMRDVSERIDYPLGYCFYANAVAYPLELKEQLAIKDSILLRAVEICKKHGFKRELARKYHSLGLSDQIRRRYQRSVDWYLQGLQMLDEIKDSAMYGAFYNNLSVVYKGLRQNEKSYEYGEKALAINRGRKRWLSVANAQINLGIIDTRNGDLDKAMERYKEALVLSKKYGDRENEALILLNEGEIYLKRNEVEKALDNTVKAEVIAKELNQTRLLITCALGRRICYKKLGRIEESFTALQQAEMLAKSVNEMERIRDVYTEYAEYYKLKGDYKKAFEYQALEFAYADSVNNREVQNNINELEIQYETERQEREIAAANLEVEKEKQKSLIRTIALIAAGLVVLVLIALLWQRQRLNRVRLKAVQNEKALEIVQMREFERARIASDMHDDLGSGLTSIRMMSELAIKSDKENKDLKRISTKSAELVTKMSEIIWAMNPDNDSLENLIAYTRAQCGVLLEEWGGEWTFTNSITQDKLIEGQWRRDVFLIVKEAVHNAVKYSGGSLISISFEHKNDLLHIHITDNGKGMTEESQRIGSHGLKSMKQRAERCGGQIGWILENGVDVSLTIPFVFTTNARS